MSLNKDVDTEDQYLDTEKRDNFSLKTPPPPQSLRLKYYPDMSSAAFFAMTFEYKWKYKFSDQDLSDLFKECYMLLMIQVLLTLLILFYSENAADSGRGHLMNAKFEIQAAYFLVNVVVH